MRYGIFSDIHGNLEAFEVAIGALLNERIDKFLCVGDIVGYGADPAECVKKTRSLNPVIVCGNHDAASVGLTDIRYFNEVARQAVLWTQKNLSQKDMIFLKGLDLVYKNQHLTLAHGTLHEPEEFHYMFDRNAAVATFGLMETQICFVGHSHVPGIFSYKGRHLSYLYREKVRISKGERMIVNVGSIGQPRDGDPRLCFCVYDTDNGSVELKKLSYDVAKTQKKIINAGLPCFLADRLSSGV
ncbi:MAG: hypothetical protein A2Y81_08710 [Nitrospirae bacterium RBG_13_43_8]|nr:MAG: hypothetical protein A2Y81_08710 [Nitrospirae bacterium RBG_13_43_8]